MKVIERVLERRIKELVNINAMQFGFMHGRRTIDALFVVRRMPKKYKGGRKCWVYVLRILRRYLIEFQER